MVNNNYLDFLIEHKLSAEEFLILYSCYNSDYDNLLKYREGLHISDTMRDLIDKGWIDGSIDFKKIDTIYPTEKFTKHFLEDAEEAANEIWELWYPGISLDVNGKLYSSKGIDYDEFVLAYRGITKNVVKRHLEIKTITKNYVEYYKKPQMQLKKYIGSRFFDDIASRFSSGSSSEDKLMKEL